MPGWASTVDVANITGRRVDDSTVDAAGYVVDVAAFGGAPPTDIGTGDTERLRMATAYQAAQMQSDPNLLDRINAKSVSWPDFSVTFASERQSVTADPLTVVLAPLASVLIRSLDVVATVGSGRASATFPDSWGLEDRKGVFAP